MTIMIHNFSHCELGEWADKIVGVIEGGTLVIYPNGYGVGPSITMSLQDWVRIRQQADAAIADLKND